MQTAKKTIVCAALAAGVLGSAHAGDGWNPVSDTQLDELRGGFDSGSGLKISFGIERQGYINGELISSSGFNSADANRLSPAQANAFTTAVIHNGAANGWNALQAVQPSTALVIQNALNGQDIRSLTVINASTNSLDLIKSLNLQSALTDALVQALGHR